jgi:glycosidase
VGELQERMLYFLENHDEQRIASGFFCGSGMCAEPAMTVAATLGKNPVLIYAGQELGEKGMDVEGFSGIDGRSSIFDYWGLSSIQAWADNGKFDGKKLTKEQKELRLFYQRLLTIARDNKAITEGLMYDLEYAQKEGFNKHEQYAFLRKKDEELLLIVVNFDDKQVDVSVRIPEDAFTYLAQPKWQKVKATDLLTGKQVRGVSLTGEEIRLTLPAWKSMIIKVEEIQPKSKAK